MNDSERIRERMAELGRKSGERRRQRAAERQARTWADKWIDDLEAVAAEVRATGNGLARVRMTELALEAKRERLAERELELEERERAVTKREGSAEISADWLEMRKAQITKAEDELEELERARGELDALIRSEAAAHDIEVIDDEV